MIRQRWLVMIVVVWALTAILFANIEFPQEELVSGVFPRFVYLNGARIPPLPSNGWLTRSLINSAPGVTGPGVPFAIKEVLGRMQTKIDEEASTFYGAEKAVDALEEKCRWIPEENDFHDKSCFSAVGFERSRKMYFSDPSLIDIVTPSIRNLDFLNDWREFFQGFHIIIIQDGDPATHLEIPYWVDYELYNRNDIKKALGSDEWIISSKDASIRNFGFLVSKKKFIYTIDDDCLPAKDSRGNTVNPLALHLHNLQTPSNPYFFNTLYDPYATGSDFVRGYPYSLRGGVPTAISHGLWLFTPDYDAPTQLLKPLERNTNHLNMAMTVPHGILYPMCSMNVAFSRTLIGPAFMQGLMGEGQPWGRYDDMFAGWASKVVADHLGLGVKSGKPYIRHNKLSNPFVNLKKEYKGLVWQEEMIRFFADEVRLSKEANTPIKAYEELAHLIKGRFTEINPYFERLSNSMIKWTQIWDKVSRGGIVPVPSRVSDSSVLKKYPPINIHPTGGHGTVLQDEIMASFPNLGANVSLTVTSQDVTAGHRWKTFILPLDEKFHEGSFHSYLESRGGLDCLTKSCDGETLKRGGRAYTDYHAEIIIFRKLLGSLHFVKDLADADMVLVPVLGVSTISVPHSCRSYGKCRNDWYSELQSYIQQHSDTKKKHLFIATQQDANGNILISLGPRGVVVPSLNSDSLLQPSSWKDCKPIAERQTFLLANIGTRHWLKDRNTIVKHLESYSGNKTVMRIAPGGRDAQAMQMDSILTICPPGDLPFQKRFFDALLHCSIPVVIKREVEGVGPTYWSNVNYGGQQSPKIVDQFPQLDFPYSEIVVEVDGNSLEVGEMMNILEKIPRSILEEKWRKIDEVRNRFLYDFEGTTHDAFSVMLDTIWEKHISKLV